MRIDVDGQNTSTHSVICVFANTKFKKKRMKVIPYNQDILQVELEALKWGLDLAISMSGQKEYPGGITVVTDRQDLASEFNGDGYRMSMLRYDEEIQKYLSLIEGKNIKVMWVPREANRAGMALEKRLKTLKSSINYIVSGRRKKRNGLF